MTSWWSIHLGLLSISDSSLSAHQRIVLAGEGARPTRLAGAANELCGKEELNRKER